MMMKQMLAVTCAVTLASAATCAFAAGDAVAGKQKAAVCFACHGANGIGMSPLFPNLAGQKDQYLVKQLKAFRGGERKDPTMSPMAQNLSDQDIDDLAAYFSSLPGK